LLLNEHFKKLFSTNSLVILNLCCEVPFNIKGAVNMTRFNFNGEIFNLGNYAKHHKEVGILIGRTKEDGSYENLILSEGFPAPVIADFQEAVDTAVPEMFTEEQKYYEDLSTSERYLSTFRYAILNNIEYKDPQIEGYEMIGVGNMHSQYIILYSFYIKDGDSLYKAHIERILNVSESCSIKFHDALKDNLKVVIEEIIEEGVDTDFDDLGIGYSENGDEIYRLIVEEELKDSKTIDISLAELENALYSVQVIECTNEYSKSANN